MKILWKYKVQMFFVFFICGLAYVLNYKPAPNERIKSCFRDLEKIKSYAAYGKIIGKYIDTKNHNTQIIYVKNFDGTATRFFLNSDRNYVYDSLTLGDLFKKKAGDAKIYYGKEKLNKLIEIDYKCNSLK